MREKALAPTKEKVEHTSSPVALGSGTTKRVPARCTKVVTCLEGAADGGGAVEEATPSSRKRAPAEPTRRIGMALDHRQRVAEKRGECPPIRKSPRVPPWEGTALDKQSQFRTACGVHMPATGTKKCRVREQKPASGKAFAIPVGWRGRRG
jgi:hypothetical protein